MSKTDADKKKRRSAYIIGGVFVFLMLLSTLGYAFTSSGQGGSGSTSTTKVDYNNYKFEYSNGYWTSNINGVNYIFQFNPKQTNTVSYEKGVINPINNYYSKPLYYSTGNDFALGDLATNLNPYVERIQEACFVEKDCPQDMIVKSCSDNFIIIKVNETNSIRQEQNCLIIEGKESDLSMLSDEALFNILGVK